MFLDAFVSVLVDMEGDGLKKVVSNGSIAEVDDYDLSKLLDHKPRLNVERQKSFDESELLIAANWENLDNPRTLGVRSGMDTIPDTPASYSLHPAGLGSYQTWSISEDNLSAHLPLMTMLQRKS